MLDVNCHGLCQFSRAGMKVPSSQGNGPTVSEILSSGVAFTGLVRDGGRYDTLATAIRFLSTHCGTRLPSNKRYSIQ